MSDTVIKELWQIKDVIAREKGYNIDELVAYLRGKEWSANRQVVDLRGKKEAAAQGVLADVEKMDR
jgi:hypothetical protein